MSTMSIYTDTDTAQAEHVCRWLDKYGKHAAG